MIASVKGVSNVVRGRCTASMGGERVAKSVAKSTSANETSVTK